MEVWGGNRATENGIVMPGLDAWIYSKPHGQAEGGGDVYYVSACATGRITRLLVADVSGHGANVSQTATDLRWLMQKYVNYIDQRLFVRSMNQQFSGLSKAGTFATAVVSTFFGPTNDLTTCIAGHPPPLLYRAKNRLWTLLNHQDRRDATNIPLGINDVRDWAQFGVRLQVGDLVLCYTDSLIESRGPNGKMLGVAGLRDIVAGVIVSDPRQVVPRLLDKIASLHPGNLEADDVTVLLFRPNGLAPAVPLKEKLFAPFRVMRAMAGSLFGSGEPLPWPELSVANIGGALFRPLNRLWSKKNHAS